MNLEWHYSGNESTKGPYTAEQIKALIDAEVITKATMLWNLQLTEWIPAAETVFAEAFGIQSTASRLTHPLKAPMPNPTITNSIANNVVQSGSPEPVLISAQKPTTYDSPRSRRKFVGSASLPSTGNYPRNLAPGNPASEPLVTDNRTVISLLSRSFAAPPMGFFEAIRHSLSSYAIFSGRASRSEFWWFYLFCCLAVFLSALFGAIVGTAPAGAVVFLELTALGLFLPSLAVYVRRLHDINMSGWWVLLGLIPIFGSMPALALLFPLFAGVKGPYLRENKYN